jgi:plasmid stabilization system protein ParE
VQELVDACYFFAEMPMRFPLVARHEDSDIRKRAHGQNLIFYRVEPATIQIVRILSSSMDYEKILF